MIDVDKLQKEILQEKNITRLFEIQIDLSKLIKNTHTHILMAETQAEQSEAKGNLGIYKAMLDVLQNRITTQTEIDKQERNEAGRINYNFRLAAKVVLQKNTYKQIMDLAMKTRTQFKENADDLYKNKLA